MRCLYNEMRRGATLGDRRFRSPETIARRSGYSLRGTIFALREMEARGEVEVRRGLGRAHGNRKLYRLSR